MASRHNVNIVELVRRHQADVWRYLRVLGCEPSLAEDLTQETFVTVFRKPFEVRGDAETAAYLRKAARNLFLMSRRAASRRPITEALDDDELDIEWRIFAADDGGDRRVIALEGCIEKLDERARRAVELRYRRDEEYDVIGQQLELSGEGAKTLLRRIKEQLKDCIERTEREP